MGDPMTMFFLHYPFGPPSALTALLSQRRQVKRQFRVPRVQGWRRRRALRAQRCAAHAQAPRFRSFRSRLGGDTLW